MSYTLTWGADTLTWGADDLIWGGLVPPGYEALLDGNGLELTDENGEPIYVLSEYQLVLAITPLLAEPGGAVLVQILVTHEGEGYGGQVVTLYTSDPGVGDIPATVTTAADGRAVFSIIGIMIGTATIAASMVAGGAVHTSNTVAFAIAQIEEPEDYDATGYGSVVLVIESALANALTPKVQRLSHQEQERNFPGDTGLRRLSFYETAEIVFLPKVLQ